MSGEPVFSLGWTWQAGSVENGAEAGQRRAGTLVEGRPE